ncbi:gluconate 2-dehydrogenase subunit 3 family protein [Vogesella sp. LIG4]|uniref:gluconate 2-dehydrogenase subunit 3 family protein n=1 Tax=Vogesella sp. LIG4 TaxID=1192162 RepID=UPI00081F8EC0|nr:gluconate 2-dehydrogenase subunit 3 family protein [Vogesella sp. LIG4]SCK14779.1 Gluconate 2-dehydrogenase subunit 3 [Vogesella sp. LIG4]
MHLASPQRRQLLQVVAAFFVACGVAPLPAAPLAVPDASERRTLAAFVDVLLPRDALSPAASELQVDDMLWQLAGHDARFRQLLALGCQWLNLGEQGQFAALAPEQQQAVVAWMAESDWNHPPRRFYELVRQSAISGYYSQPAARAGLDLPLAPQPQGYPPPWD